MASWWRRLTGWASSVERVTSYFADELGERRRQPPPVTRVRAGRENLLPLPPHPADQLGDAVWAGAEHSYVFYWQDTERLAGPTPHLGFAYSYFETHPGFDRDLAAAEETEDDEIRRRAGENGSHETRPLVTLRDWRKPLPAPP